MVQDKVSRLLKTAIRISLRFFLFFFNYLPAVAHSSLKSWVQTVTNVSHMISQLRIVAWIFFQYPSFIYFPSKFNIFPFLT